MKTRGRRPEFFRCWLGEDELERWKTAAQRAGAASLSAWVRQLVTTELELQENRARLADLRRSVAIHA